MDKPKLVLSTATTFFSGHIEAVFKKAKRYGFQFLEIIPYKWTTYHEIRKLQDKYQIKVAGVHLPLWWPRRNMWQIAKNSVIFPEIPFSLFLNLYLGSGIDNPGLEIAQKLGQEQPVYLLMHSNLILEINRSTLQTINQKVHLVIENIPSYEKLPEIYWNSATIQRKTEQLQPRPGIVFDVAHLDLTLNGPNRPKALEIYKTVKPEVVHIGYGKYISHRLPNKAESEELRNMLKIHKPNYIVIETNPLVSVKKGKRVIDDIVKSSG